MRSISEAQTSALTLKVHSILTLNWRATPEGLHQHLQQGLQQHLQQHMQQHLQHVPQQVLVNICRSDLVYVVLTICPEKSA